ncbi:hypothetical protein JHK86_018795 [Glycine max]|nr:hypothetical protein JHK86_018795 [Glycine max]
MLNNHRGGMEQTASETGIISNMETPRNDTTSGNRHADDENLVVVAGDSESDDVEGESVTLTHGGAVSKSALRVLSDLGNLRGRHSVIEIRDEGYDSIRRTVSMDHSFKGVVVFQLLMFCV